MSFGLWKDLRRLDAVQKKCFRLCEFQPVSGPNTPPKWLADLGKEDLDMLQGKLVLKAWPHRAQIALQFASLTYIFFFLLRFAETGCIATGAAEKCVW